MKFGTQEQSNTKTGIGPSVSKAVAQDILDRMEVGIQRYGESLHCLNGRDPLVDAYQEALDLAVYLRQELMERNTKAIVNRLKNSTGSILKLESPVNVYTADNLWYDVDSIVWNGRNFKLFNVNNKMIAKIEETETFIIY